jgi:NitT/TauT family transport system substrate-binding protein
MRRRRFLGQAGGVAASSMLPLFGLSKTGRAADLRPVSMRLDWLYQGPNAGFIVAREQGFYRDVGLDVSVGPGTGSGSTAQLVANKNSQFGFVDGYVLGNSIAKGMNIRMVASVYRRNPTAVVVLADSAIKTPKDLEGKTIGIPTGAAQFQQWPAFVRGCGLDGSKIKVVNVDPAGSPPALIAGRVDAISGFGQGYVPSVELRGKKAARVFWYSDCGVTAVSNGIVVHNDLVKEDPALIRAFVAASIRGFLWARQHPQETAAIVSKYAPTTDPAITVREMEWSWPTWVTPNTAGQPLGWMSDKDWAATVDALKLYGGVSGALTPEQIYTNDFVPSGAEFIPPQSAPQPGTGTPGKAAL